MNYRHLQYFAKVVQHGSIKRAAEQLDVSQPTVSAAVRKLETEFGATLLDRRREGSVPTVYGRYLYDTATTMKNVVQTAHDRIASLQDPSRGTLRVGTGPSVSTEHVAVALARVLDDYPNVRVTHVRGDGYQTFEQMLTVDDIDVALCHVPERELPKTLRHQLVSPNPIGALIAASHLPVDAATVSAHEVMETFRWITPRDDVIRPPHGAAPVGPAGDRGPLAASLAEDLQMIKRLAQTTRSIGFLPLHMVENELRSGEFVELVRDGATVSRPIYALSRVVREQAAPVDAFLEAVTDEFGVADRKATPHRTVRLT